MKRRALVVDDDRSMVKTLSDVLRLSGWEVSGEYSGDAVAALHQLGPAIALILYSGQRAKQEMERALPPDWIHAYLQKPFAVEQLTGVLDAVVD